MLMPLYRFADWFAPDNLRDDPNTLQRIRVTVASSMLAFVFGMIVCAVMFIESGGLSLELVVLGVLTGILPLMLFLYRLTGDYTLSGVLIIIPGFVAVVYGNYFCTGGREFALIWFACAPLLATLIVGRWYGYLMTLLAVIAVLLFVYLSSVGYAFPDPFAGAGDIPYMHAATVVAALAFLAGMTGTHEWTAMEVRAQLSAEIEERKRTEQELNEQKDRAQITLRSIVDGVITTNARGGIEYMNPTAMKITGWGSEGLAGASIRDVLKMLDADSQAEIEDPLAVCLEQGRSGNKGVHILVGKSGRKVTIEHSCSSICDMDGRISGAIIVFHDVTVEQELTRQISYQATHDALTGLTNRHEFEQRLLQALENCQTYPAEEYVLCFLDLDQFKVVNDTCGHRAGDELLCQIAYLLKDNARESDIIARLGGDEFAVILDNCSIDNAVIIAENIRERIAEFRFPWDDRSFSVSVSIGLVSLASSDSSRTHILSAADAACYAAKEAGRNRVHVYDTNDTGLSLRHDEIQWIGRLKDALDHDSFVLVRQPILALQDSLNGHGHFEILIRMRDADGELIAAEKFLTAAERFNLMTDIDRWVIQTLVAWFAANPGDLENTHTCCINLSGHSLNDERFSAFVKHQLTQIAALPSKICFEITETTAIANLRRAKEFIIDMKGMGCRFALDDFGKGMSSLAYLKNLPVDYLKIDGQFVKDITSDAIDRAMVESINHIGHVLGLRTIAEFVESQDIHALINDIGVDYAQGYAIGRPEILNANTA